ncbi:hypothetical protein Cpin_5654 [Chitinophaga pinensis DSM 2588]|uniref:Uncharacterized protein n=1 Tax=Chitinophaga pinensis (strain ATCC 43595 / DSM 2588 / LMG 13176 / NBRC 15968 / NCIMB 11800 / UQM 2034) TaxID=485918 RepID=A0A979GUY9_CHIPD|nr:hypothetical protein Cpin_5654 [Chitinophaga pinensis DSM 2588]
MKRSSINRKIWVYIREPAGFWGDQHELNLRSIFYYTNFLFKLIQLRFIFLTLLAMAFVDCMFIIVMVFQQDSLNILFMA